MKHTLKDPNNSVILTPELMHYGKEVDANGKFVTWVKKPTVERQCSTCLWAEGVPRAALLGCRRFAPRPTLTEGRTSDRWGALWPTVACDDYCGEWEAGHQTPVRDEAPTPGHNDGSSWLSGLHAWRDVVAELASSSPLKFGWLEQGSYISRTGKAPTLTEIKVYFPSPLIDLSRTLFWPQATKKIEELLSVSLGGRVILNACFFRSQLMGEK